MTMGPLRRLASRVFHPSRKQITRSAQAIGFFALIAVAQYGFMRFELVKYADSELSGWAEEIAGELTFTDKSITGEFRNSSFSVPNWLIVSRTGTLIDIDGLLPGLLRPALPLDRALFTTPTSTVSDLGERWRMYARALKNGSVVVGIQNPEDFAAADTKLVATAAMFGNTVEEAMRIPQRKLSYTVETAVLGGSGEILRDLGGLPLKTVPLLEEELSARAFTRRVGKTTYRILVRPILSPAHEPVGQITVYRDISPHRQALLYQVSFNFAVVLIACVVTFAYIWYRWLRDRNPRLSLTEALAEGEGERVEFKASFQWNIEKGGEDGSLRREVLKSVAAFMNTRGGQLFIGVNDDGTIRGLAEDLALAEGSQDALRLMISAFLMECLGPAFADSARMHFEHHGANLVCEIEVERTPKPVFARRTVKDVVKTVHEFFVRVGNSTKLYQGEDAYSYISRHWS